MELTVAEEKLINAIREIDIVNPLGIDGYTSERCINTLLRMVGAYPPEAKRRYELFREQSKGKRFVDIREAQREKRNYEDIRADEKFKADYEANYKRWMLPAPVWLKEADNG